jgi:plasmid stabilization system protein ParE
LNEVVWTAESLANLRAIRAYIEQFNPEAAETVASSPSYARHGRDSLAGVA